MVISSCSLAEARLLLDNFLKASIDKVSWQLPWHKTGIAYPGSEVHRFGSFPACVIHRLGQATESASLRFCGYKTPNVDNTELVASCTECYT